MERHVEPHEVPEQRLSQLQQNALRGAHEQQGLGVLQNPAGQRVAEEEQHDDREGAQVALCDGAVERELDEVGAKQLAAGNPDHGDGRDDQNGGVGRCERPQAAHDAGVVYLAETLFLNGVAVAVGWRRVRVAGG